MSTELFPEAEMPFNLVSQTIAAPVKILSPREEEAARAAIVRAGGYEHTPPMFDALFRSLPACHQDSPQHAAYVARVEQLEAEGCDTSDAQGIADMEFSRLLTQPKKPTKQNHQNQKNQKNQKMKTTTKTMAEYIITALIANNVEPQATHTAAPGRDWGFVAAYLADDDTYAIKYGDNGATSYDMADDIDDLALWLITDDADTVARCNARDEEPETVADDYTGACCIISARDFNGPTRVYGWITDQDVNQDNCQEIHEFETKSEAQDWIDADESEIYHLEHNESGRPDYFIVAN